MGTEYGRRGCKESMVSDRAASFCVDAGVLPDKMQEEFLEMKCISVAKDNFETVSFNDFWIKYVRVHSNVNNVAMSVLLPFSVTYT